MPKLNLKTKNEAQELVKAYLEENASEILADKINNGVRIQKDGKTLINKKTLDGFMKYATEEARKLASKGASSACVKDAVVYGWAIHYFEEDTIVGTLYNEDGTEYKPPMPEKAPVFTKSKETIPMPAPKPQTSLFDMLTQPKPAPAATEEEPDEEELLEDNTAAEEEKTWLDENTYADTDGVIHSQEEPVTEEESTDGPDINTSAFDAEALCKLSDDFGDEIEVR